MNLMRGIDLAKIAEKLPGASGAEIKAVCTEAGMYALRERRVHVTQEDFEMAVAKVWKLYRCLISLLRPEWLFPKSHRSWPRTTKRICLSKSFSSSAERVGRSAGLICSCRNLQNITEF